MNLIFKKIFFIFLKNNFIWLEGLPEGENDHGPQKSLQKNVLSVHQ